MNKQQLQTYFNPIQELLNCPQGEETAILQQNDGLSNQEFIPVVKQYADLWQKQETESNNAAWLSNIPQTLTEYLKGKGNKIQDYLNFLQQALQAEIESNNNPAVVYPILQQHQHLLDDVFAQLLPQWLKNTVSQMNPEEATAIVEVIENLCIDINEFPLGSRANNLEIAIKGYETVLEMRPRATMAEQWAMTQNNLGNAYYSSIRGERVQNIEDAIQAYEQSLEVYTCEAFPYEWAMTQNNLGTAYSDRIQGERNQNIEAAIQAYEQSLEVYTHDAFPYEWATTQNNLGTVYSDRIQGERNQNIEAAIQAYEQSLEIRTREAFPYEWAMTQNNLGTVYSDRIQGERNQNIEAAIQAYEQSTKVLTLEEYE